MDVERIFYASFTLFSHFLYFILLSSCNCFEIATQFIQRSTKWFRKSCITISHHLQGKMLIQIHFHHKNHFIHGLVTKVKPICIILLLIWMPFAFFASSFCLQNNFFYSIFVWLFQFSVFTGKIHFLSYSSRT